MRKKDGKEMSNVIAGFAVVFGLLTSSWFVFFSLYALAFIAEKLFTPNEREIKLENLIDKYEDKLNKNKEKKDISDKHNKNNKNDLSSQLNNERHLMNQNYSIFIDNYLDKNKNKLNEDVINLLLKLKEVYFLNNETQQTQENNYENIKIIKESTITLLDILKTNDSNSIKETINIINDISQEIFNNLKQIQSEQLQKKITDLKIIHKRLKNKM